MGGARQYIAGGGFAAYQYRQVGDTLVAENGVSGKIIAKIEGLDGWHSWEEWTLCENIRGGQ